MPAQIEKKDTKNNPQTPDREGSGVRNHPNVRNGQPMPGKPDDGV